MSQTTFHIDSGSPEAAIIRAAYEIILGCLSLSEVTKKLDVATVEKIAKRLNDLLPGGDAPGAGDPVKTLGALWSIEQSRRLRIIDAMEGEGPRVEVYKADLRALMEVQVPVKP
ncbi:hypothetical protein [Pseudomonas sp. S1(2024)]|uniref:hypothetical protein n=1 Tax=Pseudomonas sp. S1(2024) TaxID=3390191 RepID=UPI00397D2AE0